MLSLSTWYLLPHPESFFPFFIFQAASQIVVADGIWSRRDWIWETYDGGRDLDDGESYVEYGHFNIFLMLWPKQSSRALALGLLANYPLARSLLRVAD